MTIGSLFAGIGGLELGLERVGVGHTVWQVELDPFCRSVLARHWPDAERFENVQDFDGRPADLICGGFPCQDISDAGKRAGIDGDRSALWREFARIISLVRPRIVVVENVAALLTRGMGAVLGDLATLGYDAIWDCVPASAVGAPHRRDRIFVVAWQVPDTDSGGVWDGTKQPRWDSLQANQRHPFAIALGKTMADAHGPGATGGIPRQSPREQSPQGDKPRGRGSTELADDDGPGQQGQGCNKPRGGREPAGTRAPWPPSPDDLHAWRQVQADSQPSFCRVADGLPEWMDRDRWKRLKALGNSVVPHVAEVIGRVILEIESQLAPVDAIAPHVRQSDQHDRNGKNRGPGARGRRQKI